MASYGTDKNITDATARAGHLAPTVVALGHAVDDLDVREGATRVVADRADTTAAAARDKNGQQDTTLGSHASRIGVLERAIRQVSADGGSNVVIRPAPLLEDQVAVGDLWLNTDDMSLHHYATQGFPAGVRFIGWLNGDTEVFVTDADLAARAHPGDVWLHPNGVVRVRNEAGTAWEVRATLATRDGHTIQNAGTALAQRPTLDFLGEGVVASDDSVGNKTVVQVPGRHTVQDEGTSVASRPTLNFVGTGVAVTDDATNGKTVVTVSGGSGGHTLQDEGVSVTQRPTLNFVGTGVAVTDDATNGKTVVTIGGGGGGHTILHPTTSVALTQRGKLQIASPAGYFTANDDATNDITVLAFTNAAPGHKITAPGDPATVMAQRTKLNISGASGVTVTAGDSATDDVTSIVITGSGASAPMGGAYIPAPKVGEYSYGAYAGVPDSSKALASGELHGIPHYLPVARRVDAIAAYVVSRTVTVQILLSLYKKNDAGTDWVKVADGGSTPVSANYTNVRVALAYDAQPGEYLAAVLVLDGTTTMLTFDASTRYVGVSSVGEFLSHAQKSVHRNTQTALPATIPVAGENNLGSTAAAVSLVYGGTL